MKNAEMVLINSAQNWENATPVGNGSLGVMLWGIPGRERLTLNEESIWSGGEHRGTLPGFRERFLEVRSLLLEGMAYEATKYAEKFLDPDFDDIGSYEYAGEVFVELGGAGGVSDYIRKLDMARGIASVRYTCGGVRYESELFASHPAGIIAYRLSASETFDASVRFERPNMLSFEGKSATITAKSETAEGGHGFCVQINVESDGKISADNGRICITGAKNLTVYIAIASEWKCKNPAEACRALLEKTGVGYERLKSEHVFDFSALMSRSEIDLGGFSEPCAPELLERLKAGDESVMPGLCEMYFNFGKYLLVSSSRPGGLPANLQGVWSEGLKAPWESDYHTNINLQMNYWPSEVCNLGECAHALFDYINNVLLEPGKRAAEKCYGAKGAVLHHISDIYGFCEPGNASCYGMWMIGGAWLCFHMWEHYLYTRDLDFLKNTAYPYIRECVLFFLDTMFEDKSGRLLCGPSMSPENSYCVYGEKGERLSAQLCLSPTMDVQVIGGLFEFYIETEKLLGLDLKTAEAAGKALEKMPKMEIGSDGRLNEWLCEYEEREPGHRHISQAFGLFPAAQITENTPELFAAIEKTIETRLKNGGGHTGWSRAWLVCLFARLKKGEEVFKHLRLLFEKSTLQNLLDSHPPFQIDGNFGGAAGIAEMLLQSHEGCISVCPALSKRFASGSFRGFRARGGFTVDAAWENCEVKEVRVTSDFGGDVTVRLPDGRKIPLRVEKNRAYTVK